MHQKICLATLFLLIVFTCPAQQKRYSFTQPKMGSPFTIIFYLDDSLKAGNLAKQSFAMVDSFAFIFSDYVDSSELSLLSAAAVTNALPVKLSPALWGILMLSKTAYENSGGAFDITIGPVVKMWRNARKTKQFPTKEMVAVALSRVGFNKIIVDTSAKTVTLTQPGMQLDLGGIAQGYIAQKIINFLTSENVSNAMVDASGDIVTSTAPPGLKGWVVGINTPQSTQEILPQKLLLHNKAVTTSGDVYQFMEHGGKRYSHITNPRTGYGLTTQKNVTVIANDGTTADWLATACSILSIKKAKRLALKTGADVLIATLKKGKLKFYATKGFAAYWKRPGG